jgi:hypothetical protein
MEDGRNFLHNQLRKFWGAKTQSDLGAKEDFAKDEEATRREAFVDSTRGLLDPIRSTSYTRGMKLSYYDTVSHTVRNTLSRDQPAMWISH